MQTIKKKKIKTAKKHKQHQIENTTESIDETKITQTNISEQEQEPIKHKTTTSKIHEQTIKQISLEVAPEQIESIAFDEKILPIDCGSGPKPIETQPIFHAKFTQAASIVENETHTYPKDTPLQKCSVNVSELTPLIVTQIDENENVESKQPDKIAHFIQLSPKIITSSATIADQVIPCDNVNTFETKTIPTAAVAETGSVPHESKIIYEQFVTQKEDELIATYAPNFKQAHETISAQSPIEIHAIDVGETEKDILEKYEPAMQLATCQMISSTALSSEETFAHSIPEKFYPEMIIATEVATTKFVEQIPYQTHELCTTDTENVLHGSKQAHVEFSDSHAIIMEQTDASECETLSLHDNSDRLMAIAKDTISLHKEIQTGFSQAIDTVISSESIPYATKTASISLQEMGGKLIETVNVLQSEQPFEGVKPLLQLEASSEYTSHEGLSISETLVQESNIEFSPTLLQASARAMQSHEEQKTVAQCDELLFETTSDYKRAQTDQNIKAQVNFEPKKSIISDTVTTHDSEKAFDTNFKTWQPQYTMDTSTHASIMVSQTDTREESSDLTIEPVSKKDAKRTVEIHKTHHQQSDVQVFRTTDELYSDDKVPLHNVQVSFELQKSTISESVIAHDQEQTFETQLKSNEPHYSTETDVKTPIMVSETNTQEGDTQFLQQPVVSTTAIVTQELHEAPESSTNQLLETIKDYKRPEMQPEYNANIAFELQKSTVGEEIMAHDTEHIFEQPRQIGNEPQYSIASSDKSPVIVTETQIIDTESSFSDHPSDSQYLNVSVSSERIFHAGSVSEMVPYDSIELMQSRPEKGVSAKTEPIVFHGVTIDEATLIESSDQFEVINSMEQRNAVPAVITKTAINVTMEQPAEFLNTFNENSMNKEQPIIKHGPVPMNSIIVGEMVASEHSTHFDTDATKTAIGSVSTVKHSAKNVDETWPIDSVGSFKRTAVQAHGSLEQNFIQSKSIQTTTVIATDTTEEFQDQIEKPQKPKYSVDEFKGFQTEDIISHENIQPSRFLMTHETAQGHVIHDFEVQHRCQQVEQIPIESTGLLHPMETKHTVHGIENISNVLTTAQIEEVITNQSGEAFRSEKPDEHRSKIVQESFNVVGQSAQQVPLEGENLLSKELKLKEEYSKKSIEGRASYIENQTEALEKESDLKSQYLGETQTINVTMEPLLSTTKKSENVILSNVQFGIESVEKPSSKTAVPKIERLLEGICAEDKMINEATTDTIKTSSKTLTAKPSVESKESLQIEKIRTYEKENELNLNEIEPKTCDLHFGDNMKVATSQITQIIEQTHTHPDFEINKNVASELASEINQNIVFEGVYLEAQTDIKEVARTSEIPTHAVRVTENFPLYKETMIDEKETDKLLMKPLVKTQETTELRSAKTQSEIDTLLDVKVSIKDEKITNQKKFKKSEETTKLEGRWFNRKHSYYYRNCWKEDFK